MYKLIMKYWRSMADKDNGLASEIVLIGPASSLIKAADLMGSGMQVNTGLVHIRISRVNSLGTPDDCHVIFESPDCRALNRKIEAMLEVIYNVH